MAKKEKAVASLTEVSVSEVSKRIYTLRGYQVMLDSDLAGIYQVETKTLKRAVKRNIERFPQDFMFEPTKQELELLRCQIGTSSLENDYEAHAKPFLRCQIGTSSLENYSETHDKTILRSQIGTSNLESIPDGHGGNRYAPFVFTESGVAMLSSVLHSTRAIQVNIEIMRIFVHLRKGPMASQVDLVPKLESMENMFKERFDRLEAQFQNKAPAILGQPHQRPVDIIQNVVAQHFGLITELDFLI